MKTKEKLLGPKITLASLVREVIRLAKKYPNNVYSNTDVICKYASGKCSNNSHGCIIGQALKSYQFDVKRIDRDTSSCDSSIRTLLEDILKPYIISHPKTYEKYVKFLSTIQGYQDDKKSWGEAYSLSKNILGDSNV